LATPVETITDPEQKSQNRYDLLVGYGTVSITLFLLGGWFTYLGVGPWYEELDFAPFQPPPWLFTPAWTVVLSLLAWSTWKVARADGQRRGVGLALALYEAHCVLNAGWSLLFFTLRRPDIALCELPVLDATLALMTLAYARVSRPAAWFLAPYLAWLLLATAINGWIVQFNPPTARTSRIQPMILDHDGFEPSISSIVNLASTIHKSRCSRAPHESTPFASTRQSST
jgi:tryptophan-rich sensory protein